MRLDIQGVSFGYNSQDVISGIEFKVSPGEVVGIVGPNGSGKTTLLKCINRVVTPRKGTVFIEGKDTGEMDRNDIARQIGVVPQNGGITFPFTVLDVVLMGRMPSLKRFEKESERDIEIVREAMEMTSVTYLADREIDEISGGEKQRVIIARALAQQPKILLLDEPTLHLDVNHQIELMDLITRLAAEKDLSVIMVSHDLDLAARYCDSLIMLNDGKIQAAGEIKDVLTPENLKEVFKIEGHVTYDEDMGSFHVRVIGVSGRNQ